MESGEIEKEFEKRVRPTKFPTITRRCQKLTKITQKMVDECSATLTMVLPQFYKWIKEICVEKNVIVPTSLELYEDTSYAMIVTWSNSDLREMLRDECRHKHITYANYLKFWVNGQEVAKVSVDDNQ